MGCVRLRGRSRRRQARADGRGGRGSADVVVVTSDNHDPKMLSDRYAVAAGAANARDLTTVVDRSRAIAHAIANAGPADVVLIAGKGHESYQIVGAEKLQCFGSGACAGPHWPVALECRCHMSALTVGELARVLTASAMSQKLIGDGRAGFSSVSTDSRTLKEGALFVALRAITLDGHDYIARAFESGAAAAIGRASCRCRRARN